LNDDKNISVSLNTEEEDFQLEIMPKKINPFETLSKGPTIEQLIDEYFTVETSKIKLISI